jgi:type IV pilus assembly protein PilC
MSRFLYRAKNDKGEIVSGTVQAKNEFEADKILQQNKLYAVDIMPEHDIALPALFLPKITLKDRALFARQLATMISAGLPLTKSLSILARQARTDRLREIFYKIYRDLEEGYSFSTSLAKHPEAFDRVFVSVAKSGESSGNLDTVLEQLAKRLESSQDFALKIKGALYYPIFVLIALVGIATYMLIAIIPKLEGVFTQAGVTLPWATRALIAISGFVTHQWWLLIIIIAIIFVAVRFWLVSDAGSRAYDDAQLRIPIVKDLSQGLYMSRFARIMEMLIKSGVPILDSLKIVSDTMNNIIYEETIREIVVEVERGVPLSTPLQRSEVFPNIIGQMVAVGEQTGKLDQVLDKVATYYEEETSEHIKALSTLVEPIILIIVGAGVAFIIFAILVPIYNIAQVQ